MGDHFHNIQDAVIATRGGRAISKSNRVEKPTRYDLSGANIQNSILNFESSVTESILKQPRIQPDEKAEFTALIKQLTAILSQAPTDKKDEVDAVIESTQHLVQAATKDKPNRSLLKIAASGLKQAIVGLADVVPMITKTVTHIIDFVGRIGL